MKLVAGHPSSTLASGRHGPKLVAGYPNPALAAGRFARTPARVA
jgi:hypothetical protein